MRKIDYNTADPKMSEAIRKFHFYTAWRTVHPRSVFFRICNNVRLSCGLDPFTPKKFDEGWQYRTVLHKDYKIARDEFFNLCFGWW